MGRAILAAIGVEMTTTAGSGAPGAAAEGAGAAPERPIRVLVVDDDALMRKLLGIILAPYGIEMVGEADDGDAVLAAVRAHYPDVVLMDLRMARVSGIEATAQLRAVPGAPGVIALTSFDTEASILDAVAAGVAGFLAKDADPEDIVMAVRQVAAGEGALSPRAARVMIERMHADPAQGERRAAAAALAGLTARELDVARGVAQGLSNGQLAELLFVSEATVKTHLNMAMQKTGTSNRVQLAVLAVRAGL